MLMPSYKRLFSIINILHPSTTGFTFPSPSLTSKDAALHDAAGVFPFRGYIRKNMAEMNGCLELERYKSRARNNKRTGQRNKPTD